MDPLGENIRVIFKVRTLPSRLWDGGGGKKGRRESKGGRNRPRPVLFLLFHAAILVYERPPHEKGNRLISAWLQRLGCVGGQLAVQYTEALSRRQSYPNGGMDKVVICVFLRVFKQRLNDWQ